MPRDEHPLDPVLPPHWVRFARMKARAVWRKVASFLLAVLPPHWVRLGQRLLAVMQPRDDSDLVDWEAPAQRLLTPCRQPIWQRLWLLLALAFALRLLAAWHGHWIWRVDEYHQYLEQAHRVVFGYGTIPWEYYYGARTWLIPGMVMPPLYVAKWLGVEHPWTYATMVNSWNALLSMSVPIGVYFTTRRMMSERVARWALIFACFWYEFIILAPRTVSELYSTYFFMAGLALAAGTNRKTWLYVGFLLGMAIAFRIPYAMVVGILAVIGLVYLPRRCSLFAVLGGVAALLLWGLVDFLTWGGWWASIINFLEYVPILYPDEEWEHLSPWRHTKYLTITSYWLYPLALVLALVFFHRFWLLWLLVVIPLFLHQLQNSQDYSNIFILLPLLWMLIAGLIGEVFRRIRTLADIGVLGILTVSIIGASGALPQMVDAFRTTEFFSIQGRLQIAYRLHDFIEKEDNTVLVDYTDRGVLDTGGFYGMHHNIPVLFLYSSAKDGVVTFLVRESNHHTIWRELGHPPMHEIATHVIARQGQDFGEAEIKELASGYVLHIMKNPPIYPVQDAWVYDYINVVNKEAERLPPRDLTPYNPDL